MNTLSSEKQNKKIVFALEHNENEKNRTCLLTHEFRFIMLFSLL